MRRIYVMSSPTSNEHSDVSIEMGPVLMSMLYSNLIDIIRSVHPIHAMFLGHSSYNGKHLITRPLAILVIVCSHYETNSHYISLSPLAMSMLWWFNVYLIFISLLTFVDSILTTYNALLHKNIYLATQTYDDKCLHILILLRPALPTNFFVC